MCQACYSAELKHAKIADFAARIHPRNFDFSPRLTAIVGAIIGHDYGVRDSRGGYLTSLYITSDGFVMASSTAHESGAMLSDVRELETNLLMYLPELTVSDLVEFQRLYTLRVTDYRSSLTRSKILDYKFGCIRKFKG